MSSASTSTSLSPPPPQSPGRSSSSASTTTPSSAAPGSQHRSRPSFAIAYSQPPAPKYSSSSNTATASGSSSASTSGTSVSRPPLPPTFNFNPNTNTSSHHAAPQSSKHFVAPAHPQSHYLHTLPPREKTTRTLILDHTAWLHGRTRFAQGRCELGMKVRFRSEERAAEGSSAGAGGTTGKALYIGTDSGSKPGPPRANPFGDPPEVELASSDEEGEDGEGRESDGEGVRVLGYGKRSRGRAQKRKDGKKTHASAEVNANANADAMEVDSEVESNSEYDTDGEPSARQSTPSPSRTPSLAPALAARAIGIEKVLDAMLSQPPSSPPRSPSPEPYALHSAHAQSQHYRAPPSTQAATTAPASATNSKPLRLLPNGVRLRLALLALVNDLFERQPPASENSPTSGPTSPTRSQTSGPFTSTNAVTPTEPSKSVRPQSPGGSPPPLPPPSIPPPNSLPPGLTSLAQVSSQPFYAPTAVPSFHTLTLPSSSGAGGAGSALSPLSVAVPGISTSSSSVNAPGSNPSGAAAVTPRSSTDGAPSPTQTRRPPPSVFTWTRPSGGPASPSSPLPATPRSVTPFGYSSYDKDVDRASAPSPISPSFSRPLVAPSSRALPASWKGSTPKYQPTPRTAVGRSRELYSTGCYATGSVTSTYRGSPYTQATSYRSNVTTFGYGAGAAPVAAAGYPVKKLKTLCPRHLMQKCTVCASGAAVRGGPSTRIGAGLLKKERGLLACAVRGDGSERVSGSILADMIPRFLRLSALVAMELGREASGEEAEATEDHEEGKSDADSTASTTAAYPTTRSTSHARPTRAWYALLCSLLTRAVLEGYVARGWKGPEYVEVLMGVGLGIKGVGTRRSLTGFGGISTSIPQEVPAVVEEDAGEFEPDEMPGLIEAGQVLFKGLVLDASSPGSKDKATQAAEEEYVLEMEERMSEFLTIPHSTPDLATHLVQLSSKYPAEPIDRAALRFCEAVARWRGKPELETYKKSYSPRSSKSQSSTPGPLSIHALLASTPTPTPHRPPIDKYFCVSPPPSNKPPSHRMLKRQRSAMEEERQPKKEKVEAMEVDLSTPRNGEAMQDIDAEWVGPYGV